MTRLHSCRVALLGFIVAMSFATGVQAHPGHGTTNPTSPAHLLEPIHFVTLLAIVCVVGLLGGLLLHRRHALLKARADQSTSPVGSRRRDG